LNKTPTYAWIDSMIALSWIQGTLNNWKTFVANRVSEIQNLVPSQHWNHVKSEENAADVISRGIDPSKKSKTLFHGGKAQHGCKETNSQ